MQIKSALSLFAVASVVAGCGENFDPPTGPSPTGAIPGFEIRDGAHGPGNSHFYFLPPLVPEPTVAGVFDPSLLSAVAVQACVLNGSECLLPLIAEFTSTTGRGSQVLRINSDGDAYFVWWATNNSDLDVDDTLRIRVLADGNELGYADVDVVNKRRELKNVDTGQFVGLEEGKRLKIRFRIEIGALPPVVASVAIIPESVQLEVSETAQLVASTRDADGNLLTDRDVLWTSSNEGVATVNANGIVTAVDAGMATIVATSEGITGEAAVTVIESAAGWKRVAAGLRETCAITAAGILYCWGNNTFGEVGDGSRTQRLVPTRVDLNLLFSEVAAGNNHVCAITDSGAAYCWGNNQNGQMGNGTNHIEAVTSPVPVAGSLVFESIDAGGRHACGQTTAGLTVCWGLDNTGQTGDGMIDDENPTISPNVVVGGRSFLNISAGGNHTCGVETDGLTYCWGSNHVGQIASLETSDTCFGSFCSPTPLPISGDIGFVVTAPSLGGGGVLSGNHTCALTAAGVAYCWGFNQSQALGVTAEDIGFATFSRSPVRVSGNVMFGSIHAGSSFNCGIDAFGAAHCWGSNSGGQLGTPDPIVGPGPVPVMGGHIFTSLSSGQGHTCGITPAGELYCWGQGDGGQLGNGGTSSTSTPVLIPVPM